MLSPRKELTITLLILNVFLILLISNQTSINIRNTCQESLEEHIRSQFQTVHLQKSDIRYMEYFKVNSSGEEEVLRVIDNDGEEGEMVEYLEEGVEDELCSVDKEGDEEEPEVVEADGGEHHEEEEADEHGDDFAVPGEEVGEDFAVLVVVVAVLGDAVHGEGVLDDFLVDEAECAVDVVDVDGEEVDDVAGEGSLHGEAEEAEDGHHPEQVGLVGRDDGRELVPEENHVQDDLAECLVEVGVSLEACGEAHEPLYLLGQHFDVDGAAVLVDEVEEVVDVVVEDEHAEDADDHVDADEENTCEELVVALTDFEEGEVVGAEPVGEVVPLADHAELELDLLDGVVHEVEVLDVVVREGHPEVHEVEQRGEDAALHLADHHDGLQEGPCAAVALGPQVLLVVVERLVCVAEVVLQDGLAQVDVHQRVVQLVQLRLPAPLQQPLPALLAVVAVLPQHLAHHALRLERQLLQLRQPLVHDELVLHVVLVPADHQLLQPHLLQLLLLLVPDRHPRLLARAPLARPARLPQQLQLRPAHPLILQLSLACPQLLLYPPPLVLTVHVHDREVEPLDVEPHQVPLPEQAVPREQDLRAVRVHHLQQSNKSLTITPSFSCFRLCAFSILTTPHCFSNLSNYSSVCWLCIQLLYKVSYSWLRYFVVLISLIRLSFRFSSSFIYPSIIQSSIFLMRDSISSSNSYQILYIAYFWFSCLNTVFFLNDLMIGQVRRFRSCKTSLSCGGTYLFTHLCILAEFNQIFYNYYNLIQSVQSLA